MKTIRRLIAVLAVLATTMLAAPAASYADSSDPNGTCLHTFDPDLSGDTVFNWSGKEYVMFDTDTLYTGGSSSTCHDINIAYAQPFGVQPHAMLFGVQYLSGGLWHDDPSGLHWVQFNSGTLVVLRYNAGNNAPYRLLYDPNPGEDEMPLLELFT